MFPIPVSHGIMLMKGGVFVAQESLYKDIVGYCPHLKKENKIRVEYADISVCGTDKKTYKYAGFECSCPEGCKLDSECPLSKIAMSTRPQFL